VKIITKDQIYYDLKQTQNIQLKINTGITLQKRGGKKDMLPVQSMIRLPFNSAPSNKIVQNHEC